jgi:DNA polymerase elongation subunit (family B)
MRIPAARVLDFDIETRPLSYTGWGNTDEITSIACSWYGQDEVYFFHIPAGLRTDAQYETASVMMLSMFVNMYEQADIVTGHYIRNFDLPKINGALLENGLNSLSPKLTSCTKNDLVKFSGLSKSQENLGLLLHKFNGQKQHLGLKEHVAQMEWRQVNRLTVEGIEENRRRVEGDVRQHKQLREALLLHGMLRGPKTWRP